MSKTAPKKPSTTDKAPKKAAAAKTRVVMRAKDGEDPTKYGLPASTRRWVVVK